MRHLLVTAALILAPTLAAAQDPFGAGAPPAQPRRAAGLQVHGGVMFPVSGYRGYVDDVGWMAGAVLTYTPTAYYHLRVDAEYNAIGTEVGSGSAALYGGGFGGGRSITQGSVTTEGYLVGGAYNVEVCVPNISGGCDDVSEIQFGTKIGATFVMSRGRVQPILNVHWLYTWGTPYASTLPITLGLRF